MGAESKQKPKTPKIDKKVEKNNKSILSYYMKSPTNAEEKPKMPLKTEPVTEKLVTPVLKEIESNTDKIKSKTASPVKNVKKQVKKTETPTKSVNSPVKKTKQEKKEQKTPKKASKSPSKENKNPQKDLNLSKQSKPLTEKKVENKNTEGAGGKKVKIADKNENNVSKTP